tara:strand:- start:12833 stop:13819 length:987 start_codon:yes stop_codon:yes gene_type:complete
MKKIQLGQTDLWVSRLILGAMGFGSKSWREWVLEDDESFAILKRAVDCGINTFDTCDFYSSGESERILGTFIKQNLDRNDVVIATKFGMPLAEDKTVRRYSWEHVRRAVEGSLKRLQIDHIDLYQTHIWDRDADIEEMMAALDEVVREGKVRHIGITDMPAWQLAKAQHAAERSGQTAFASVQNHYNLIFRDDERELLPLLRDQSLGWIPYSPMGRGFLCGTRRREGWGTTPRALSDDFAQNLYFRESDFAVAEAVGAMASERGCIPAQVGLMWVLQQPGLTAPVIGATDPGHIDTAVAAIGQTLSDDQAGRLETLYEPRRLPQLRHG